MESIPTNDLFAIRREGGMPNPAGQARKRHAIFAGLGIDDPYGAAFSDHSDALAVGRPGKRIGPVVRHGTELIWLATNQVGHPDRADVLARSGAGPRHPLALRCKGPAVEHS